MKHPHVRGDDQCGVSSAQSGLETPPHAWGRLNRRNGRADHIRNTPTCVGTTGSSTTSLKHTKKHPHGRGDDQDAAYTHNESVETPPRAWGRPVLPAAVAALPGNTPTGVGTTNDLNIPNVRLKKHPHGRGDDHGGDGFGAVLPETPPRAWGRLK